MRHKLDTFSVFANSLYPHEADYLMSIQQFTKGVNLQLLETIRHNSYNPEKQRDYDPAIDKRAYSYLKTWITQSLEKADVDRFYGWLAITEKQVMVDAIVPEEELLIIAYCKKLQPSHFFFLRFYELVQYYRDFLLIRVRNQYLRTINEYLQRNKEAYQRSKSINEHLDQAAAEIIRQHENLDADPIHHSQMLRSTFGDHSLDGYTRYRAAVRLTFLYYNYREFENLREVYDDLDKQFKTAAFYSKRLLSNYYSNRAMMHSKLHELALAEKFGYLSIRQKNSDYLFYLANLCGVLLRSGKFEKALKLMNASIPEMRKTNSFYNKIGFASFYTRTLVCNKMVKNAVSYAGTFLDAFKKEIFETRWHLFFSAYAEALMKSEKYSRLLALIKHYNLLEEEKKYIEKSVYMPVLLWHFEVALYMEGKQSREKLEHNIIASVKHLQQHKYRTSRLPELLKSLAETVPAEIAAIRASLNLI